MDCCLRPILPLDGNRAGPVPSAHDATVRARSRLRPAEGVPCIAIADQNPPMTIGGIGAVGPAARRAGFDRCCFVPQTHKSIEFHRGIALPEQRQALTPLTTP